MAGEHAHCGSARSGERGSGRLGGAELWPETPHVRFLAGLSAAAGRRMLRPFNRACHGFLALRTISERLELACQLAPLAHRARGVPRLVYGVVRFGRPPFAT